MIVLTDKHKIPFQIDEDDHEAVKRYPWFISQGYPTTNIGKEGFGKRPITLHLFLLGPAPDGLQWDHTNRNRRDNQRSNFRAITQKENTRNLGIQSDNTSGVPGVWWDRQRNKWVAEIKVDYRRRFLGRFTSITDAAAARAEAEGRFWGRREWDARVEALRSQAAEIVEAKA